MLRNLLSRRRLLQTIPVAAAAAGSVAALSGTSAQAATIPSIGAASITRLWCTRTVRQRIEGTRRYRSLRVPRTRALYEGTDVPVLNKGGLCHWPGTPALFNPGNCVLFGHRTSAGGPLRNSHRLRVGDQIVLTSGGTTLAYTVMAVPFVIASNDVSAVVSWGDNSAPFLTLVACSKANRLPTSKKYRLLVRAQALPA